MTLSVLMSDPRLRGRPAVARPMTVVWPMTVVRALTFSVLSTVLAIATYHFVSGAMPTLNTRALTALGLFCVALPLAARPTSFWSQLAAVCGGQAVACWWFELAKGGASAASRDDWLLIPVHAHQYLIVAQLVLTLLAVFMLHGADTACRRLLRNLGNELHLVRDLLRRLLLPSAPAPRVPALPQQRPHRSRGPARASPPHALLADAVVRRGPPPQLPFTVRPC